MNVPTVQPRTIYFLTLFRHNRGIIDGLKINANYTVSNYIIEVDNYGNQSGHVYCTGIAYENHAGARIENCEVTINAYLNSGRGEFGGICSFNEGKIANCLVKGSITSTAGISGVSSGGIAYVNGLYYPSDAEITGCTNRASISGYSNIGGIATQNDGKISSCLNEGTLTLNYEDNIAFGAIGGIAGSNGYNYGVVSSITLCRNTGIIRFGYYPPSFYVFHPVMGIIIGRNYGGSTGSNILGGSMDLSNLPERCRQYAGYREIGREM